MVQKCLAEESSLRSGCMSMYFSHLNISVVLEISNGKHFNSEKNIQKAFVVQRNCYQFKVYFKGGKKGIGELLQVLSSQAHTLEQ